MSDHSAGEEHDKEQEREAEDQQHAEVLQSEHPPEEETQTNRPSEMDDDDVAEMSMIAAQIESAEDFNLTFETVDTSDLHVEEEKPKGRRRSLKNVSPLYESERHEIEEFLEEGINESLESVVDKANTSVAEALLGEWGSPRVDPKRSALRPRRSAEKKSAESKATIPTTPSGRQPLKELTHTPSNTRKRLSSSSIEGDGPSPGRKRRSSTPKSDDKNVVLRRRTTSISNKGQIQSEKQILKARNV